MHHATKTRDRFETFGRRLTIRVFRLFNRLSRYFGAPLIGPLLKRMADLEPEAKTQGYTLNLNADLTDLAQGVVLPIDMMKRAVRESEYRAIVTECLCRTSYDCKTYPHDHGCLFIGGGARAVVKQRMGREASVEEALAHIDKGAELGLIGQALWIEVERFLLGIKREKDVAHWLEMCFCCPCCCGTFKLSRATAQPDIRNRFQSVGWKAVVDDALCVHCGLCVKHCPITVLRMDDDALSIDEQACLGCGFCAKACPKEAIALQLRTPLLESIEDYFARGGLKVKI